MRETLLGRKYAINHELVVGCGELVPNDLGCLFINVIAVFRVILYVFLGKL